MTIGKRFYWALGLVAVLALAGAAVTVASRVTSAAPPDPTPSAQVCDQQDEADDVSEAATGQVDADDIDEQCDDQNEADDVSEAATGQVDADDIDEQSGDQNEADDATEAEAG